MRKQRFGLWIGVAAILAGLIVWECLHWITQTDKIPSMLAVGGSLAELTTSGRLFAALIPALQTLVQGYLLALLVGIPVGLLAGRIRRIEIALDPYLNALFVLPLASIVPILIFWLGTGPLVRVVGVFLFSIFPITINVIHGVKDIPKNLIEMAHAFGASSTMVIRHIVLPHIVPFLIGGLRLGMGMAVRGIVVVELVVSVTGFGELITRASYALRFDEIIAIIVVLMLLGLILTVPLEWLESWLTSWQQGQRAFGRR